MDGDGEEKASLGQRYESRGQRLGILYKKSPVLFMVSRAFLLIVCWITMGNKRLDYQFRLILGWYCYCRILRSRMVYGHNLRLQCS